MRDNQIATVCYVRFGRRPHGRTVRRVLETGPTAIRTFRRFAPYHEIPDAVERRLAIVTLHSEGWNTKSIAGYLKTSRPTVYRALKRWIAEGVYGLEDRPRGAKRKADLRVMNEVRKLQQNPELGEFRVSAALELLGIYLSPRTCGRILAVNRELYGLKKPKRGAKEKREMPFQSSRRHEIWSVDVRYLDHDLPPGELPEGGKVYSISVLENHSRALLASAVSTSQDLTAYLSVLYTAVERYGAPEVLVSDGRASSRRTRPRPSTAPWASARRPSRRGSPGRTSWRPPSTYSAGWQTTTSPGPKAGRSSPPPTTGRWSSTTPRCIGRTANARTRAGARRRS
jgi:putative transposase